jgi:MFS family permease
MSIFNMAKLSGRPSSFDALCNLHRLIVPADKIGRRPVIFFGITGLAVTTTLFGLSKSLPMMLTIRALAGLSSGNTAVIHAVVGELTDASNQAVALSLFGLVWPLGTIIG